MLIINFGGILFLQCENAMEGGCPSRWLVPPATGAPHPSTPLSSPCPDYRLSNLNPFYHWSSLPLIIITTSSYLYSHTQTEHPLLLALVLVELQNTCKKKSWTEKCSKDPTYAIFLKSWGFKDVKYDILMCQSHSTRPHNTKKSGKLFARVT